MNITENVMFGDFRSYDDFGLILKGKSISAPSPKVNKVDVNGRNGSIDFTDALGGVRYENRKITMRFLIKDIDFELITAKMSQIMMAIHGQEKHIIFADDEAYYWKGRITVETPKISKGYHPHVTFNITADVEPYKYSIYTTDEDWLWNPFDFENDVINETSDMLIEKNTTRDVEIVTLPDDRVTAPIVVSDSDNIKVRVYRKFTNVEPPIIAPYTEEIPLHKGSQVVYESPLKKDSCYIFRFINNSDEDAIVSLNYLGGSL